MAIVPIHLKREPRTDDLTGWCDACSVSTPVERLVGIYQGGVILLGHVWECKNCKQTTRENK